MKNYRVRFVTPTIFLSESLVWDGIVRWKKIDGGVAYRPEISGEMVFCGGEFDLIMSEAESDCVVFFIEIERLCDGVWAKIFDASFSVLSAEIDYGRKVIRVDVKVTDAYECFLRRWNDEDKSMWGATPTVIVEQNVFVYDTFFVNDCGATSTIPTPLPEPDYCLYSSFVTDVTNDPTAPCGNLPFQYTHVFHRILATGTTTTPPIWGTGWTLLIGSTWWACPDNEMQPLLKFKQGRYLQDAINEISQGCGLTVSSHFFNFGGVHADAPENIAYTFATNFLSKLTIHQKSDIKRPLASLAARERQWRITVKELLDDLSIMFNLGWSIIGNRLVIEHISYFQSTVGIDVSGANLRNVLQKGVEIPEAEQFEWMDEDVFSDFFEGVPLEYECGKGTVLKNKIKYFSTDLRRMSGNDASSPDTSPNAEAVADAGFVLCANYLDGSTIRNFWDNEPLSFTNLHENLYKHYRKAKQVKINGVASDALSVKPSRTMQAFTIDYPTDFDPSKAVLTALGIGEIETAQLKIAQNKLTITVKL